MRAQFPKRPVHGAIPIPQLFVLTLVTVPHNLFAAAVVRMPFLDAAVTIMAASAPCSWAELEACLSAYGLTRRIGAVGLLAAARITGRREAFTLKITEQDVALKPFDDWPRW